jgi:Ca-activated chloride channel family protein
VFFGLFKISLKLRLCHNFFEYTSSIIVTFNLLLLFSTTLYTQVLPNKRYVIILDASGSMSEKWDGKTRMAVAKEQLNSLLDKMGKDVSVGLVAYGNRIAGCSSARLYQPIQRGGAELVKLKLNGIIPAGSTPIAQTLTIVGEYLLNDQVDTEIIFISDGVESCEGDPKSVLYNLKTSGKKFNLQILGIDIDPKGEEDLKRLALVGNGRYYSVKKPEDYLLSFNRIFSFRDEPQNIINLNSSLPQTQPQSNIESKGIIRIQNILPYSDERENGYILTYEYDTNINKDYVVQIYLFPKEEKLKSFPLPPLRERRMGDLVKHQIELKTGARGRGRYVFFLDSKKQMNASAELWEIEGIPKIIAISDEKPVQPK